MVEYWREQFEKHRGQQDAQGDPERDFDYQHAPTLPPLIIGNQNPIVLPFLHNLARLSHNNLVP